MFFVVRLTGYDTGVILAGPFRTIREARDWIEQEGGIDRRETGRIIVVHREKEK